MKERLDFRMGTLSGDQFGRDQSQEGISFEKSLVLTVFDPSLVSNSFVGFK